MRRAGVRPGPAIVSVSSGVSVFVLALKTVTFAWSWNSAVLGVRERDLGIAVPIDVAGRDGYAGEDVDIVSQPKRGPVPDVGVAP